VFHHFAEIGIFLVVLGGFTVYVSLEFLKGKGWARIFLEVLTWVCIFGTIAFYVWFVVSFYEMYSMTPPSEAPGGFMVFFYVAIIFNFVILFVPLVVILWFMRGRVRRYFENLKAGGAG